jgi:hypothetical protein
MGQWKDLPDEINSQIVEKFFNTNDDMNWRFASRQLYNAQQTLNYEHTTIDLKNDTNRNISIILHSPFKPGKRVKIIIFDSFTVPKSLKKFNKKTGPRSTLSISRALSQRPED